MKRIAIIGCAGSGKSTLAFELKKHLSLPVYHLDYYYWKPNWARPDFEEFRKIHDALCDQEEWIIDGIYSGTLDYRIERADCVIFLDVPRRVCLWRVLKRLVQHRGKVTVTSAPQCPERFSFSFLRWIWNFEKRFRSYTLTIMENYAHEKQIYIIKSLSEKKALLEKLTERLNPL